MHALSYGGAFSFEPIEHRSGFVSFRVVGKDADQVFKNEPGGHRFQRTPPNEKRGRIHTSTVTVACLPEPTETEIFIDEKDLEITATRGSGPGGQHRNMTASAVQIKHIPTGVFVRYDGERSQHQNKRTAMAMLRAKLWQAKKEAEDADRASNRKAQVGSGMRGCKVRTIRYQDEQVHDHVTGKRWRLRDYLKGEWD
jgi:peptide chain release factor 1